MSRPALWCCQSCGCPLGRIVDGDLHVFGTSTVKPGRVDVPCLCKAVRIWYASGDAERRKPAETARTSC